MDNIHISCVVTVNSTSVIIKGLWYSDITSNGSSLGNLLHHVFFASDMVILVNLVDQVLVWNKTSLTWTAVSADVHSGADSAVVMTASLIDRAGLIGDLVLGHPLEGVESVAAVAAVVLVLAGDEHLRGNVDLRPGTGASNLDSVGER